MQSLPGFLGIFKIILGLITCLAFSGCSSLGLGYLFQAGRGQFEICNRSRPIDDVIGDERTPSGLKLLLARIPEIKKFGEANALKATKNYTHYVQLDRPAASWVVSASDPLEFKPKVWKFPIVGSFTYLGWFDLKDALHYADQIRTQEQLDVDVRGAGAYSTVGWFRDPVLSTMIGSGPDALGDLVNTVLHESAHATFYINGQSYFNESLAQFVGDQLAPNYLKQFAPDSLEAYLESEARSQKRAKEFQMSYLKLSALYSSRIAPSEKLLKKAEIISDLKAKVSVTREINNATLIQFKTYGVGRPELEALLGACQLDWKRFWKKVMTLSEHSFSESQQSDLSSVFQPLIKSGCSDSSS